MLEIKRWTQKQCGWWCHTRQFWGWHHNRPTSNLTSHWWWGVTSHHTVRYGTNIEMTQFYFPSFYIHPIHSEQIYVLKIALFPTFQACWVGVERLYLKIWHFALRYIRVRIPVARILTENGYRTLWLGINAHAPLPNGWMGLTYDDTICWNSSLYGHAT